MSAPVPTLADRIRRSVEDAPHLYGVLGRAMADDWERGGPTRRICVGWEQAPDGSAVHLRLLAGVFRIVASGRAPELAPFYLCLGGTRPAVGAWPAAREVLEENVEELRAALAIAPQTNEPARSAALLAGLTVLARSSGYRRMRLLEPGASAGLGLLVDRFRFTGPGYAVGPGDSPLVLHDTIRGPFRSTPFEVVERRGCDPAPVDITSDEGRLRLRSFVWPWQLERHARLAAALEVAAAHPVTVDRALAADWLEGRLTTTDADVLTVVWHSITRQYWSPDERDRVELLLAARRSVLPLARVAMEFPEGGGWPPILTITHPHGGSERLGTVHDHGVPVQLGA